MDSLGRLVLGSLSWKTPLLETFELTESDFSSELERKIFSIIARNWETDRPEQIALALIADEFTSAEDHLFVSSLCDGLPRPTPETFGFYCRRLRHRRLSEKIVRTAERLSSEHLRTGVFDEDGLAKIKSIILEQDGLGRGSDEESAVLINLADVAPQPVRWIWKNRILHGKLNLIAGDPEAGKSFFSLFIAAHVTLGSTWPDGAAAPDPGSVIVLAAEDGLSDTIRPRSDGLGADVSKIKVISAIRGKSGTEKALVLSEHLPLIEKRLVEHPDTRLLIIDPISSFLGADLDAHRDNEIRPVLGRLAALAEQRDVCILLVGHFNKSQTQQAIYRPAGSIGFVAGCRSVWAVMRDPVDETHRRRLFMPLKNNLSPEDAPGLAFRLVNGQVLFEKEPLTSSAEEILSQEAGEERTAIGCAAHWLKEALAEAPLPSSSIYCRRQSKGSQERQQWRRAENA